MRKFKIINPYAGVDWDSWHHYKTNLHTHSTASDAQIDFSDMIKAYYDAGFDILAMTDHGVVNHGWNQKPRRIPVLSVSSIIKKPTWLSDEEYGAILDGTYKNRGRGMTDLRYGIEINTAVFTKAHVNGFFTEYGQGLVGHENDFEGPVKGVAESGGLSVINHPGDWLESYVDVNHAHEKKNVELFADILKKYPSCLGIEAFNRIDTVTDGSPAATAGLLPGDVLLRADGQTLHSIHDLMAVRRTHLVGDTMTLTVLRDGQTFDADVPLYASED